MFVLPASLNDVVQYCLKMLYPRMHVCMLECFKTHIFIPILIYMLLRRISVHLIISVNIIMASRTTLQSVFPFLRNMSLFIIKGMLY